MDLVIYPPKRASLSDNRIYKITFNCKAEADLSNSQAANLFIRRNATSSHFIVINDKPVAPDASGNVAIPNTGTAFLPVFAISKGVVKIDNRRSCPNPQYITGGPELYLQAYANYSTENAPGILLSLGYAVAGLIPPLWAMFNRSLPDATQNQLGSFSQTEDPLKKTLTALNREENYPVSVNLSPGKYVIRTAFSTISINVKYVPSIIRDGGGTAMKFFRKQIDTAAEKLDANDMSKCGALAADLLGLGFSRQDDIPYALAYKGIRSGFNADQASQCLGDDYAIAAASIPGGLWEYSGKSEQVLTVEKARFDHPPRDPNIPVQAAFDATTMKVFTDALSRLTRADTMAPSDQSAFAKRIKEPVILDDQSVTKAFGGEPKDYAASELARLFVSKGYRRFGCHQATNLGEKLDGGRTLLLAFKADKDDASLTIENVLVLKPIFTETRAVTKLIAYDDYDWINTVMTARSWKCARIAVKQPTPPDPAGAQPIASRQAPSALAQHTVTR
jgi:hypothetical protein